LIVIDLDMRITLGRRGAELSRDLRVVGMELRHMA
jgi:hypothetical protein